MRVKPMHVKKLTVAGVALMFLAACASVVTDPTSKAWSVEELSKALSNPSRPQADRDRDENRKPAQLMVYYDVRPGMTALDVFAAGGYLTEVLSIAVGPSGKVYMQNPAMMASRAAQRLENNRLPNVVPANGDLPNPSVVPLNSADFAITAMNFHDIYGGRGAEAGKAFMKGVFDTLKPGGVFAVIDHRGNEGVNNAGLHRVATSVAVDTAKAVGFVFDGESDILANPADDRSKAVRDSDFRGKTDQFTLRFKKPK